MNNENSNPVKAGLSSNKTKPQRFSDELLKALEESAWETRFLSRRHRLINDPMTEDSRRI
jgi:hypothetical protein